MGFFVDPLDRPKSDRSEPGRDYAPSDEGYKPLINLHSNHSNLEGFYDPRNSIDGNLSDGQIHGRPTRSRIIPSLIMCSVCSILIVAIYLMVTS